MLKPGAVFYAFETPKKEGQARRSVPEVNTDAVTPVIEDFANYSVSSIQLRIVRSLTPKRRAISS